MKRLLLICFFVLGGSVFAQEQMINNFDAFTDSSYFFFNQNESADTNVSYMDYQFVEDNVAEGTGAMRVDYGVHNAESWGGFVRLEHWTDDSTGTYDWSLFDTLSIKYYVETPASQSGRVHLRVNLHDVSDATNGNYTYDVGETEYWYSFNYVLDSAETNGSWQEIKLALIGDVDTDQSGDDHFHLTGWDGISGNEKLDLDKIKGFSFEVSINGTGSGDSVLGTFLLDEMKLTGIAENSLVLFNGAAVPGGVSLGLGGWSDHAIEITDEEASTEGTKSIKWTLGSDWALWDGPIWTLDKVMNLGYRWNIDTAKFKIKAEAGLGPIKMVFLDDDTDSTGEDLMFEAGYMIEESMVGYDGTWKEVAIPLSEFDRFEGGWNPDTEQTEPGEMDSTRVKQVKLLMADGSSAGKTVYLDDVWTGNPEFDVIAPEPPGLVSASGGDYVNLITWTDVAGEEDESYDVYYSLNPITDLDAEGIEVVELGIAEDEQLATHVLRAPLEDQEITYYYAVVCNDAAGNSSEVALADPASVTNTARGVPVINNGAPDGIAIDGDLGDWSSIEPFRMYPSDGSGTVVTNTEIDGDDDLSVDAYVAMDENYLYYAFDITDDVNSIDTTIATYMTDGADLFIGFYNWHGASHVGHQRGEEPDYQFRFLSNQVIAANLGDAQIKTPGDDYVFEEKFPTGYLIEGRLSFEEIRSIADPNDTLFTPQEGMRIKIDYSINDADDTGEREGILTLSPENEDQSWNDVSRWTYTWIGDKMVVGVDDSEQPLSFQLAQNYPNPFNPATTIRYSIPQQQKVTLKLYNVLGQEVKTLINKVQSAGHYQINFNASELASGVYIYRITAGHFVSSKKMLLLK